MPIFNKFAKVKDIVFHRLSGFLFVNLFLYLSGVTRRHVGPEAVGKNNFAQSDCQRLIVE